MKTINALSAGTSLGLIVLSVLSFLNIELPNALIYISFIITIVCFIPITFKWNLCIISEYGFSSKQMNRKTIELLKQAYAFDSNNKTQLYKTILWTVSVFGCIACFKTGSYNLTEKLPNDFVVSTYLFYIPFASYHFVFNEVVDRVLNET